MQVVSVNITSVNGRAAGGGPPNATLLIGTSHPFGNFTVQVGQSNSVKHFVPRS